MKNKNKLPDIQETESNIKIPIKQVGVENVEVPFILESKYGGFSQMVANVSMRTDLSEDKKGISMSRLLLTLQNYLSVPLKHKLIESILNQLIINLETSNSYMRFDFKLPIYKESPISKYQFPIYYKCRFEGHLQNKKFRFFQGVVVQYASYCPCSAELCNDLREHSLDGFPHAQRSYANILVETKNPIVWLEDIINVTEKSIATKPYPIIKRVDEQEIARIAAENPMFVEDAIRNISYGIEKLEGIYDWIIKCKHEESIHTSEAIAINWKGIEYGFNESYYL